MLSGVKRNSKPFWTYVKSKISTRETVSNLVKPDGNMTTSDKEKAEVLQDFFVSVFTQENVEFMPVPSAMVYDSTLENLEITSSDVSELLRKLNPSKSPGPDKLHPRILHEMADVLSVPLAIIFQTSLERGELPLDWRSANVTPIFKKGNKSHSKNYRPVSLTCIVCKVLETLIRKVFMEHFNRNALLSPHQHGFVVGKSCTTHLLEVIDEWTRVLDDGGTIDAIYMDFMKAFDTVPHQRLLTKLEAYGIQGNVHAWIKAFLLGRRQRVYVNGQQSNWCEVSSGIPQGSVLGPCLFLAYINDLPSTVQSHIKLFADDTKLYVRSDLPGSCQQLQNDLSLLESWAEKRQLLFHPDKCTVLKVGRVQSAFEYRMGKEDDPVLLNESQVGRDLGVLVDARFTFKDHISQAVLNQIGC